jgi:hypothetical protein
LQTPGNASDSTTAGMQFDPIAARIRQFDQGPARTEITRSHRVTHGPIVSSTNRRFDHGASCRLAHSCTLELHRVPLRSEAYAFGVVLAPEEVMDSPRKRPHIHELELVDMISPMVFVTYNRDVQWHQIRGRSPRCGCAIANSFWGIHEDRVERLQFGDQVQESSATAVGGVSVHSNRIRHLVHPVHMVPHPQGCHDSESSGKRLNNIRGVPTNPDSPCVTLPLLPRIRSKRCSFGRSGPDGETTVSMLSTVPATEGRFIGCPSPFRCYRIKDVTGTIER